MNYTKVQHSKPYAAISPSLPHLSAAGKSVLVTGGSSGIGKATAQAFLEAGSRAIALTGRRASLLAEAAADLKTKYPSAQIETYAADVTDAAAVDSAFAQAKGALGGALDVVVSNAGYQPSLQPLATGDLDEWWAGFEINVKGAVHVARAAARHAAATADAVLVYVATAGALMPASGGLHMSAYAASKLAAVKAMEYFGAENPALRVVNVHPGVITSTEGGQRMVQESGLAWPGDDVELSAHFIVWAASKEAEFLKNKFVFANWDVDELKARKDEISQSPELLLGLNGFPRSV
ncbi:hypothetical protein M426DRAFT_105504 [Hypoxylon sp. CI-4A]|nr:hypothetical protein M426DRAFT_105504 [Hypoxylon sp. CI-4A]